ncbi:MAG: Uma2 family endonuclease [Microcoleus sp. PH2017_29_MFU_D_A]|uniref:Uma2 family endonuclease n=1 Tax=unclassified Microcoleus TaxID=2642155 RepID=UPI001D8670A2|nr:MULTISPECIES: Uma2 family endonuclease [unclassified Microcoleus]MCC3418400.1 Uma2 family endonuclease [Microcoleus sp. PH2017_07_MST_O_A]MCC3445526.1 Uma2 family endonuclease [Microcoleus sp. PH2017_03_ELD_O_A]MCC3470016.1 Uma2 family endonuclease [Microcoleus sp. PH2017_06_SFM_O_A]MCC3504597.1 Uma2 family endonuclease [Microcoleus sp. PH2017_19_SFW_U_A]MCC3512151.1 Uma2 family endonuclease [Microcoleus sp. PH2017_17_BER_D_A]TAE14292.1 MAG: Uma2 family endonuclease [Oscillatoriales cyanob
MTTLTLNLNPIIKLTDEQFFQLCQENENIRLERTAKGELIIMSPAGGETGSSNAGLTAQIWIWNQQKKLGKVFDSSTGFKLPNNANRAPDASWVKLERWDALTPEQQKKFPPICPDFVVELMSPSDSLKETQDKMKEYRDNGAVLGWLINRKSRQVEIYRPNQEVEVLESPVTVSGEDVLPGFVLNLESIW